jgi:hypothetical protein
MIQTVVKAVTSEKELECAIDDQIVNCESLEAPIHECGPGHFTQGYGWLGNAENYVGVPAPAVLEDDPWFGSAPVSDKQKDYQEATERLHEDIRKESQTTETVESDNIHQEMYEIATSNWNTVDETKQSMGGSENFQEGWNSGTGMGQYR